MNQAQFLQRTNISDTLCKAVIKQCGGWLSFKECAPNVAAHGADSGAASNFIYYTDTVGFALRNAGMIGDLANEMAKDFGYDSTIGMLKSWRCLNGWSENEIAEAFYTGRGEAAVQVNNALAWFALEEVCRAYDMAMEA